MRFRSNCWRPIRSVSNMVKFFKHNLGLRAFIKVFLGMLKELCNKDELLLNYHRPEDFVRCYWQKKPRVTLTWILFRSVIALYLISGLLAICLTPTEGYLWQKNFIYFTYWAYLVQILAFVLGVSISAKRYREEKKDPEIPPMEKMPRSYKAMWVVYTIAAPNALGVSLMYWVFIYDPDEIDTLAYTIITHVFNSVTILIDFFFAALPFRFIHVYLPLLYACLYALFTVIYQFSGGTGNLGLIPIYKILDWRDPKIAASTSAVTLGAILLMHCVFCVLNMVKEFIKKLGERGIERDSFERDP